MADSERCFGALTKSNLGTGSRLSPWAEWPNITYNLLAETFGVPST